MLIVAIAVTIPVLYKAKQGKITDSANEKMVTDSIKEISKQGLNIRTLYSSIRCFQRTVDSSLLNAGMGGMTGPPGGPQATTTASDARAIRSLFCDLA